MRKRHTVLTDKQWVPLVGDDSVRPFDQTNGVATATDGVSPDGPNDTLTLIEKGAASSIIAF